MKIVAWDARAAEPKLTAEQLFGPDPVSPPAEEPALSAAEVFAEQPAPEEPPADTPTTIVSAMRLHRKKRPAELIRAFVQATSESGAGARLIVAEAVRPAASRGHEAIRAV